MRNQVVMNEINESKLLNVSGRYWNTDYDSRYNQLSITFKSLDDHGRSQLIEIGNLDLKHINEIVKQLNLIKDKLFSVPEE